MIQLRPYQSTIIDSVRNHFRAGKRSVLICSPTGSGKTSLTAHMVATAVSRGKTCWFTVHRSELVTQSIRALETDAGLHVGVIAAGFGSNGYAPAQVCSIQTLMKRWERYPLPDLLVIDECHHACSKSWSTLILNLLTKKPSMKIIGLTATPCRLDGRGLGEWFEVIVEGPPVAQLIAEKHLSAYKLYAPSTANLSHVHTTAGDYNKAELDEAMRGSVVVGDAVKEYQSGCAGKRALMYLWSVRASEQMAETLNAAGIPAAHIDGATNDDVRRNAIRDFRKGRILVLCNCEIATEGLDIPGCEAVFLLRPTQSLSLYLQMCGRGLRPFRGKEYVSFFDHSGMAFKHGLPDDPREWSLEGIDKNAAKKQESPVRQCMKCYAVFPAQARKCAECGYEFPVKYREVEQEAGELQEVDPKLIQIQRKREQASAKSREELEAIARRNGYRSGWVDHILAARAGKVSRSFGTADRSDTHAGQSQLSNMADSFRPRRGE